MSIFDTNTTLFPSNLAAVANRIRCNQTLKDTTRRDLISAISRIASMLDRQPADLHAHVRSLRRLLLQLHPAQFNLTPKSFANIKADLARALVLAGVSPEPLTPSIRTREWQDLLAKASAPHLAFGLGRLASWCSHGGIEPANVSDEIIAEFQAELDLVLLTNDPFKVAQQTVQTWNRLTQVEGLDLPHLTPLSAGQYRARRLTIYSPSLRADIKRYMDRLSHADRFADEGPKAPLRPTSLRNVEAHLRQYLDALVTDGFPPFQFRELSDLLHPNLIQAAYGVIAERNGGATPISLKNINATLLAIGRYHADIPDEHIEFLRRQGERIENQIDTSEYGMSEKNIKRLAQFDDWQNQILLVSLPERLMERAKDRPGSRRSALDAMHAVALSILLSCPMRAKNLAALDLDRHVTSRLDGTRKRYSLRIEGREVKNKTAIEVELGKAASELLAIYLRDFRGMLSNIPGTALFPNGSGGSRLPGNLGAEISRKILRDTGLRVHVHMFRHIAAKLFLDRNPGEYETVRRLLGHRRLETTLKFYARLDNKSAFKRYDATVFSQFRGGRDD